MNVRFLILPVVALIGAAIWLGSQEAGLGELRKKVRVMRERVSAYEALPVDDGVREALAREGRGAKRRWQGEDGELEWLEVGRMVMEAQSRGALPQDLRSFVELQGALMNLSKDELRESLNLVKTNPRYAEVRKELEGALATMMVEKDPEGFLAGVEDQLNSPHGEVSWHVQGAFQAWLKSDPAAALAWLDEKREAGAFDAKTLDPTRSLDRQLEIRAIGEMTVFAPGEIKERLARLPEKEAKELLLESHFWVKNPEGVKAYVDLAREELGGREGVMAIGKVMANQIYEDDLTKVSEQLKVLDLNAEEKGAVMDSVRDHFARPWDREAKDVRDFYQWAKEEGAENVVELAGQAFGKFASHGNTDVEATYREMLALSEAEGAPEMVRFFAESIQRPKRVVQEIKNEEFRAEFQAVLDGVAEEGNE